ncbi:hypothetical protein KL86APRO_10104 [uncultured Alphaproteobacteria bacterium]|uniref:Uncharacterized protein n=1 Tax=uncultured Alphaproteobacteria bacterium TaxID=91750 RepID=A0A212IWG7_9PROT|nr:hypothetical protein KL86APRO_10104 [uncultured Alphaproteobacteria bacterium]
MGEIKTLLELSLADWTVTETRVVGGGNTAKREAILTNFEPLPLLAACDPVRMSAS